MAVASAEGPRQLGVLAGAVMEPDDGWDSEPEVEALFHGGEIEPSHAKRVAEPRPPARGKK